MLGFVAFTRDLSACYRWVLVHRFFGLVWGVLPSLWRVSVYRRIVESLLYPLQEVEGGKGGFSGGGGVGAAGGVAGYRGG